MSYKPNLTAHMPAASLNAAGSVHPPSTSMATSSQYRQLLSDYGPPSLGYTQGSGNSQVPQSKYAELLAIIEELGKEIRPTYAGSKSAMERLKRARCRDTVSCLPRSWWPTPVPGSHGSQILQAPSSRRGRGHGEPRCPPSQRVCGSALVWGGRGNPF
uniref:Cyclin dependent kinase 2 associated protein 1 n=1 Tax=Equus caballus TaxID=9796 RepID=A0A9L0TCK8_HORSE